MRTVNLEAYTTADARTVLAMLADPARYPAVAAGVESVRVLDEDPPTSEWRLRFRRGSLWWRQRDEVSVGQRCIRFAQTTGQLANLTGAWRLGTVPGGTVVHYHVELAVGVPIYDRIVEPLLALTFRRIARDVLTATLPDAVARHDGAGAESYLDAIEYSLPPTE
jgi:ribosome-associated toxin RatA of RatAB toxin-antitoxin module